MIHNINAIRMKRSSVQYRVQILDGPGMGLWPKPPGSPRAPATVPSRDTHTTQRDYKALGRSCHSSGAGGERAQLGGEELSRSQSFLRSMTRKGNLGKSSRKPVDFGLGRCSSRYCRRRTIERTRNDVEYSLAPGRANTARTARCAARCLMRRGHRVNRW